MPFDHITPQWLAEQMKKHGVTYKQLREDLDYARQYPGKWLNGTEPISNTVAKMLYYYFQNLECQKSGNEG